MGSIDVARVKKRRDGHVASIAEAGRSMVTALRCLADARKAQDWVTVGMDEVPFWREWYGYSKMHVDRLCACLVRMEKLPEGEQVGVKAMLALAGTPVEEAPALVAQAKEVAAAKDIPLPQAAKEVADARKGKVASDSPTGRFVRDLKTLGVPASSLAVPVITVEDVTEGHPQLAPRQEDAQEEEVETEGDETDLIESIFGSTTEPDSLASDTPIVAQHVNPAEPVDPARVYAEASRIWPRLAPKCQAHYLKEVRIHLAIEAARKVYIPVVREALKDYPKIGDDTPYLHLLRNDVRRSGPHHWAVCKHCQGSAEVPLPNGEMIQCHGCRGAGYHV